MSDKLQSIFKVSCLGELAAEYIFFLFKVAESLLEPVLKLFLYQEICERLMKGTSSSVCNNLSEHPQLENVLQKEVCGFNSFIIKRYDKAILIENYSFYFK